MKFIEKYRKLLSIGAIALVVILSAIFYFCYLGQVKSSLEAAQATSEIYTLVAVATAVVILLLIAAIAAITLLAVKIVKHFTTVIYKDSLSGTANEEMLSTFYSTLKEKSTDYAYVYMHINNFSEINNTFGFDTGNQLLKDIALCLKLSIAQDEIACRLTGNIYELLLKFEDKERFSVRLDIMLKSLEKIKIKNFNTELTYSCSYRCGVCRITSENISFDEISKMARVAFTTTEQEKRNDFAFFDEVVQEKIQFRSKLVASANGIIEQKQIEPYFQTKHDVKTKAICGAELFARWKHPDFGIITSNDFISVLEATGDILQLDLYMIEEACKLLKKWLDDECMPVPLSVNISKFNLYEPSFVDKAISLIGEYGVSANLIELQMDGDSLLGHEDKAFEVAQVLKLQGFILTIDNFGRQLIPIELLCKLPINTVCISSEFVQSAQESTAMKDTLLSVVSLAHKLKISVCTGAVESEQQNEFLTRIGFNSVQGNLYSPVVPQKEFEEAIF